MTQTMNGTQAAGRALRHFRRARGLSAVQLAERCAEVGVPAINRDVITNVENGRRQSLGVDEMLTLAYVLNAPPVAFLVPLDGQTRLRVADTDMGALTAVRWVSGEQSPAGREARTAWRDVAGPVVLHREFWEAARAAQLAEAADDGTASDAITTLGKVARVMIGSGITPPPIPAGWIRQMAAAGLVEPDDIPASD